MKKAVLSNRIFMNASPELTTKLDKILTYVVPGRGPMSPPKVVKLLHRVKSGLISIPIGAIGLVPDDYEIVEKRVEILEDFPEFKPTLRDSQADILEAVNDNCMINAKVGWGKTFTALAIAAKLGQKTLVVTHTLALRDQWAKEVHSIFGFYPCLVGDGKAEWDGPIVIGNVQTLYNNLDQISGNFGLLILDEMHHVSARTFSHIVDKSNARYKIGLSGTLKRKDGLHVTFHNYFSETIFKPKKENTVDPKVHRIQTKIHLPGGPGEPWAKRMTELAFNDDYLSLVAFLAESYRRAGHKVLVVSDRVHLLNTCPRMLGDYAVSITGEVKSIDERNRLLSSTTGDVDIVFGTASIFSEGISQNNLSCLILASPINNEPLLEQLAGRIMRIAEGKKTPVVVDIILEGATAKRQATTRKAFYVSQGWDIEDLNI